jgi:hypothetical protein
MLPADITESRPPAAAGIPFELHVHWKRPVTSTITLVQVEA